MIETAMLALLSALGILLLITCLFGFLMLPAWGNGYCLIIADDTADVLTQIRSVRFLICSGLLRLPLYVADQTEDGRYAALFAKDPYVKLLSDCDLKEHLIRRD